MKRLVLDIPSNNVYDGNGNLLGRIGDTRTEIDKEKARIYLTVNLILEGANVRISADQANLKELNLERAIKI